MGNPDTGGAPPEAVAEVNKEGGPNEAVEAFFEEYRTRYEASENAVRVADEQLGKMRDGDTEGVKRFLTGALRKYEGMPAKTKELDGGESDEHYASLAEKCRAALEALDQAVE